ncbi:MAG: CBS domain-containing protein [Clostridiales bacterium]|nr:CBS domain-containing protein [Clostridiales bacterium]
MRIQDIMSKTVVSITPEESAALAARLLTRHNLGILPVCSQSGKLEGVVTDRDIITRCLAASEDPSRVPVRDIMTRDPETLSPQDKGEDALRRMAKRQVRRIPVVEDGQVVGMVSLGDLAKKGRYEAEAAKALCDISANVTRRRQK